MSRQNVYVYYENNVDFLYLMLQLLVDIIQSTFC